jgi:uncharacterized protein
MSAPRRRPGIVAVALAALLAAGAAAGPARAGDPTAIPAAPTEFVTDRAGFLSPAAASDLSRKLEDYERGTGHQVIVWIDKTTGAVPIDDWAVRAFKAWGVGRKGHDDGVAMFIFSDDRKLRIEVGYGVEDVLPDARAGRIIQNDMVPRIRAGDRDGAVKAGVDAVLAALGGAPEPRRPQQNNGSPLGLIFPVLFFIIVFIVARRHPWVLLFLGSGSGRRGGGWGGGGGGWGGGGGGGFSGGGGSSGGGGASGGW